MKKLFVLLIILAVTDVFCQPDIRDNEWRPIKEISVSDGIVFRKNNEIYLIKPLITHYVENKIDYVGYSKSKIVLYNNPRYSRVVSPEIINVQDNIYCDECSSLSKKEIFPFDIAKKYTEFIELFGYSEELKTYEIIKDFETNRGNINLSVTVGDGMFNEIKLWVDDGNSIKLFESSGSLMFYGTEGDLFYLGVNGWGGSGYTGYIFFWDISKSNMN